MLSMLCGMWTACTYVHTHRHTNKTLIEHTSVGFPNAHPTTRSTQVVPNTASGM